MTGTELALGMVAALASGLAVAFAIAWASERRLRQDLQGTRAVDAVSDYYDRAYVRAELTRIANWGPR